MNDFTKAELADIANCVYVYDDLRDGSGHYILLKKIHSVIDNYCDHRMTSRTNLFVEVCQHCNKEV